MPKTRKGRTWTRAAHRWLGMVLLLPLTVACLTGLILNHTVDLDLSNRHVTTGWVQDRYGMSLKGDPAAFGLDGEAHAAVWDRKIFFRKKIIDDPSPLVGAVPLRDGTAVITASAVHYFGLDGELIETLDAITLPEGPILAAGRSADLALVLKNKSGSFVSDADLLGFTEAPADLPFEWSSEVTPAESDTKMWQAAFSGDGIPLDRVILDLHSGRFFGTVGKWIYDLTVIGVFILSVTGFILFLRTRRRARLR